MFDKVYIKKLVIENSPFLIVLIGIALVTFSIGPYQNYDTDLEFEAASNVVKTGMPFVKEFGVINQPPLGFYTEALLFKAFGFSVNVGTAFVTLFGLGSVVAVYLLGKELYGKSTGLFAAALFGLCPWQLILSRSFLIDAQCLFLSLLCLYVGILAIKKNSTNLTLVAGVLFAAAAMTKLYAVFMLLPLLVLYLYSKPKNVKRIATQLAFFIVPIVVSALVWYQFVLGTGILSIFGHHDFNSKIPAGVVPSYFFVLTFLNDYGIGFLFIIATVFSLLVCFSFRKQFAKILIFDITCLAIIIVILGVNLFLVAGLNLNVPYISALKYDYQALPFFCLIVASLTFKSISLFKLAKAEAKLKRTLLYLAAFSGVFLLVGSLLFNIAYAHGITSLNYLFFRAQRYVNYGFGLFNYTPTSIDSPLMFLQYLGFVLALSGLVLASRHKLRYFFKRGNV